MCAACIRKKTIYQQLLLLLNFLNKFIDLKVPELKHTVVVILINKVHPPPLYVNDQFGTEQAPAKTDELACTLFKPYDIFALLAAVKTLLPPDGIVPFAVILPVVEMLAPLIAPACVILALVVVKELHDISPASDILEVVVVVLLLYVDMPPIPVT